MKYQLQPAHAQFDASGITVSAGWALIYNVDAITGEYIHASYDYLPLGVGLPAHAYLETPQSVDDSQAIVRGTYGWEYPVDHRGKTIFAIADGQSSTIDNLAAIPDSHTLLAPCSEFDYWDGEQWVLDIEKQYQYHVKQATDKKTALLAEAITHLAYLQDAVDAEIATEQEQIALNEWKIYRVELSRIDTSIDGIAFPSPPAN